MPQILTDNQALPSRKNWRLLSIFLQNPGRRRSMDIIQENSLFSFNYSLFVL